jgi:hypothetical protein
MNVKPIVDHKFELPPDGWCHGIPICEVRIDAREVFEDAPKGEIITHVNDAAALDAIIASFRQDAAQYKSRVGAEFPGLLVDKEHFSYDTDNGTPRRWTLGQDALFRCRPSAGDRRQFPFPLAHRAPSAEPVD